jgi:hypothetical protein
MGNDGSLIGIKILPSASNAVGSMKINKSDAFICYYDWQGTIYKPSTLLLADTTI